MIKIVSFVNKNTSGFINFKNSFSRFKGWELIVIGRSVRWEGWITRMMAYRDFCKQRPSDEILVLLDGYDVLCLRDSDGFKETFLRIDKKYVFGCEDVCAEYINCRKPKIWQNHYKIYNKFINGGCIIGRAKDLFHLYSWCIDNNYTHDDQMALSVFMDHHPKDAYLDLDNVFVFNDTLAKRADITIRQNKLLISDTEPYFIHFPGLMIYNSLPLQGSTGDIPENYKKVIAHLLKEEAIYDYPINKNIYIISSILIYTLIFIIIIICIIFIIVFYVKYKNCKKMI